MKKILAMIGLCGILLVGCGGTSAAPDGEGELDFGGDGQAIYRGTVAAVDGNTAFLVGETRGDLISLSLNNLQLTGENGNSLEAQEIRGGMAVDVAFDGMIMETYPAMLSGPTQLTVKEENPDVLGMYRQVIADIYGDDEALNGGKLAAFDLSAVENLTEGEKSALVYLAGNDMGRETIQGTRQQLEEEGYIDGDTWGLADGFLIIIEDEKADAGGNFSFRAEKWKSATGAVSYEDCQAVLRGETYEYRIGTEAAS